jgi:hypothetical protein
MCILQMVLKEKKSVSLENLKKSIYLRQLKTLIFN